MIEENIDEIEVKKQQALNEMFVLERWDSWIKGFGSISNKSVLE